MIKNFIEPKSKMLRKLETSVAWIILVSMCAFIIIVKIRGYDIVLVHTWYTLEEVEGEKVFYLHYYWVVPALLCIIVIWMRGFSE